MKLNGNKRLIGASYMVVSAFFFALVGVVVKLGGGQIGVWQISFYRAIVGIVILLGLTGLFKVRLLGPSLKLLIFRGVSGTVGFLCMITALRQISLAEVMVLFYLFPAFSALFSPWVNNERVPARDWGLIGLSFLGTIIILNPVTGFSPKLGHLCALITATLAGLNTAMVRRLSGQHSPYCIYFFFCLAAAVVSFWPLAAGAESLIPSWSGMVYLVLIGVTATVGQLTMNQGFYYLPVTEGGVLLMSQVVIAASWGVLFFGEPLTWRLILGGTLILAGGAFLSRAASRRQTAISRAANSQAGSSQGCDIH